MVQEPKYLPRPLPEADALEFWEGCLRDELLMQRCARCKKFRWLPRPMCPHCLSLEREWVKVSGRGKIYSWTIVHYPVHPATVEKIPYNVIQVRLDEQDDLIMVSNLVEARNEDLRFDLPVEVVFREIIPGIKVPQFHPTR